MCCHSLSRTRREFPTISFPTLRIACATRSKSLREQQTRNRTIILYMLIPLNLWVNWNSRGNASRGYQIVDVNI